MAYVCNSQRELGSRRFVLSVAGNLLFKYVWLYRFHTKPWRSFRESANTKRQTLIVHHPKQIFCCANLTGNVSVMSFLYCVEERPVIGNCAGSNSVGSASHEPRGNVVGRLFPFPVENQPLGWQRAIVGREFERQCSSIQIGMTLPCNRSWRVINIVGNSKSDGSRLTEITVLVDVSPTVAVYVGKSAVSLLL